MFTIPVGALIPKGLSFNQYHPQRYEMGLLNNDKPVTILKYNKTKQTANVVASNGNTVALQKQHEDIQETKEKFEIGDQVFVNIANEPDFIGNILDIDPELQMATVGDDGGNQYEIPLAELVSLMC